MTGMRFWGLADLGSPRGIRANVRVAGRLLFVVTTTLAVLHALRTRGASGTKAAAAAGVHDGGVHTGV